MIAQIYGKLIGMEETTCLIDIGGLCYEIMLPGYAISELSSKIGSDVMLCTMEYLEGTPGKGNLTPRMVGFLTPSEREFFKRYTSVKGLGIKKGLKSLTIPIATIASAIENGDEKMLISLPSIGKRLSQVIIAELKGKLEDFAAEAYSMNGTAVSGSGFEMYQTEAMEILVAWGEKRNEAMELIDLASKKHPNIKTAEELVPLVYRIKQGIEV
jgi:Holliday junction DNA helicase RuvA